MNLQVMWDNLPLYAAGAGTTLLVQLFLLHHGLAQFDAVRDSLPWPWLKSAWFCAVAAFAINTCAYTTGILQGAVKAVPAGEVEATRALGMGGGSSSAASCCHRPCAAACRPAATRWC